MLVVDETTDNANCKQYNINVCCLKNNLPKCFFEQMTEVKNKATAVNLKKFVEIHLNLLMTKASVIGFDRCRTNIRERNGVKAYLRQWNPYISC